MKYISTLLAALCVTLSLQAQTIHEKDWSIIFDSTTKTFNVLKGNVTLMSNVFAEARYKVGAGVEQSWTSKSDAMTMTVGQGQPVTDAFGSGTQYVAEYTNADGTKLWQTFGFYDNLPYFVAQLFVSRKGAVVRSNCMVPLATTTQSAFLPKSGSNRMLFVPWDNDGFVHYQSRSLTDNETSYSTTAVFDAVSRTGLVMGAVDHDQWKSAISMHASEGYRLDSLRLISGYTDCYSRDTIFSSSAVGVKPHGWVVGDTVHSSRFIVGLFDDWRQGMDTYAQACTKVAPARTWDAGKPVGWSSWGTMQTKISYQGVIDVADFIKDNLMPKGFHDKAGKVTLSLDAWWNDNLSSSQIEQFVSYCNAHHMTPGIYYGPFCLFGGLDNDVPGTNGKYKYRDIALKVNGKYKVLDGAYCIDPTHPGTKMAIMNEIHKYSLWGIKYVKLDFMCNGAIEADSWYDSNITTGMEAYNKGMAFLVQQIARFNNGDSNSMFLDLSMAPLFPYQYCHGRRVATDTWSKIDNTEYELNALSFGWWAQQLYVSLDPDHLVMQSNDQIIHESLGVNRARLTSGIITGAYLTGDNFSNNVDAGYPAGSRERALTLLTNEDVNEISRTCPAFRPVEGNYARNNRAERLFTCENDQYVYLAVLNYNSNAFQGAYNGSVTFERLGIDKTNVGDIKELWSGKNVTASNDGIAFSVPYSDAALYRISKKIPTGIKSVTTESNRPALVYKCGYVMVKGAQNADKIELFSATGTKVASTGGDILPVNDLPNRVYIAVATFKGNKIASIKFVK